MPEFFQIIFGTEPAISAAGIFFAVLLGTFVSEDAACLAAGTAAASGHINLTAAIAACFIGIFAGDMMLYAVGRLLGTRVFENRIVRRFISPETVNKAQRWLSGNVASAILLSRFISGLRLPTYLAAGSLRTDIRKFALFLLVAAAIWTPLLVSAAAYSQTWLFSGYAILGMIVLLLTFRLGRRLATWRGRRLFVGRLKRLINWEFWPIWLFYSPVVLYVLLLSLRHRSLTAFTAANPAFPAGGFKGESKEQIYRALDRAEAGDMLPRFVLIGSDDPQPSKLKTAWRFMDENDLNFPIVLKPDVGERGKGVMILNSLDELTNALENTTEDVILQEFFAGEEVSVFYYRFPDAASGRIFSITQKRFPSVIGNGLSTVEELILADSRAVAMANSYFERNREWLDRVPAAGAAYRLIDIGTHSRGAVFLDGERLRTPALEAAIDDICRRIEGFHFGRFDIRVESFERLRMGQGLRIIELNGVTSESTNIYDPRFSLADAYRVLFRQWRLAFEIGAANIMRGATPATVRELLLLAAGRPAYDRHVSGGRAVADASTV